MHPTHHTPGSILKPHRPVWIRLISLIAIFIIIAVAAIQRNGYLFGCQMSSSPSDSPSVKNPTSSTTINTSSIGQHVSGYNGPVPLEIHLSNGCIDSITPLPNTETPSFFNRAAAILHSWDGLTPEQALTKQVDAVSGATFSSKAIIENVRIAMTQATHASQTATASDTSESLTLKYTIALLVALAAAICPLFIHNKRYRFVQHLLNAGVLGFWTGTFLDYSVLLHIFSHGLPITLASILTLLLMIVAFIFPLFGKRGHYCSWVCPFGSLQEIAGKTRLPKIHIGPNTLHCLRIFKTLLWALLILSLWTGMLASWIDYEIFTAFIIKSASVVVLTIGALFLILSLFIMRPFCRFVCPVGTLLRLSEARS